MPAIDLLQQPEVFGDFFVLADGKLYFPFLYFVQDTNVFQTVKDGYVSGNVGFVYGDDYLSVFDLNGFPLYNAFCQYHGFLDVGTYLAIFFTEPNDDSKVLFVDKRTGAMVVRYVLIDNSHVNVLYVRPYNPNTFVMLLDTELHAFSFIQLTNLYTAGGTLQSSVFTLYNKPSLFEALLVKDDFVWVIGRDGTSLFRIVSDLVVTFQSVKVFNYKKTPYDDYYQASDYVFQRLVGDTFLQFYNPTLAQYLYVPLDSERRFYATTFIPLNANYGICKVRNKLVRFSFVGDEFNANLYDYVFGVRFTGEGRLKELLYSAEMVSAPNHLLNFSVQTLFKEGFNEFTYKSPNSFKKLRVNVVGESFIVTLRSDRPLKLQYLQAVF